MPQAAIIGAGPAGSVAALLLARQGWEASLFEQHRFPRNKVCGECLSALGIEVLQTIGLRAAIEALSPVELTRAILVTPDGREVKWSLPRPMWGLSRWAMDEALAAHAVSAGAKLHAPVRIQTRDLAALHSDVVLLADGKSSLCKSRFIGELGLKAHFMGVESDADSIVLFSLKGHYLGLAPIEGGRWNVAMSVPARKLRDCGADPRRVFERALIENRGLARRMRAAKCIGDWLASPLPRYAVQQGWPAGVIPIGNTASAIEPIGGEGMGLAMRSAQLVAEELIATSGRYDEQRLRHRLRSLWNIRGLACRAGGVMLSRPRVASLMTRVARPFGPLAMRLVGK